MDKKDKEIAELNALLIQQESVRQELQLQLDSINKDDFDVSTIMQGLESQLDKANKEIADMERRKKSNDDYDFNRKLFQSDVLEMVCNVIDSENYCPEAVVRIIKGIW
jgi:septal ring factor EnvC (AmiA/AmiB activator)